MLLRCRSVSDGSPKHGAKGTNELRSHRSRDVAEWRIVGHKILVHEIPQLTTSQLVTENGAAASNAQQGDSWTRRPDLGIVGRRGGYRIAC